MGGSETLSLVNVQVLTLGLLGLAGLDDLFFIHDGGFLL
jgi:hypothetical protein